MANCSLIDIGVSYERLAHRLGGFAGRLTDRGREELKLHPRIRYAICLNRELPLEDNYSVLAHELGHIYAGHCGADRLAWWKDRAGLDGPVTEVEAESIAYLVCRRRGLAVNAAKHLSGYVQGAVPAISLSTVLQAAAWIEGMGRSSWRLPAAKGRPGTAQPWFT